MVLTTKKIINKLKNKKMFLSKIDFIWSFLILFLNFLILFFAFFYLKIFINNIENSNKVNNIFTVLAFFKIIILFILNVFISILKIKNYNEKYNKILIYIENKILNNEKEVNFKLLEEDIKKYILKVKNDKNKYSFKQIFLNILKKVGKNA